MGVLLLGPRSDPQLAAVVDEFAEREVETYVWDADNWPGDDTLTVRQTGTETRLSVGHTAIDKTDVHTAYLRNFALNPRLPEYRERLEERPFALLNQLREYQSVLESMLQYLEERGVRMINPLDAQAVHTLKPWQLSALAAEGVPVPETLTTTDPDVVRTFADRVGDVVYKPVSGGGRAAALNPADLTDDRLSLLGNSPVQFQERFDGDDIRVFVVDGEVVAAARIVSDELDYRSADHDVERLDPGKLDRDIVTAAVTSADCLGLSFTGVDVIDEGDRFCVLEANPSPMFATFDELAGTNVTGALADLLATPSPARTATPASDTDAAGG